jgi:superfamily I DNA/RNA helicase
MIKIAVYGAPGTGKTQYAVDYIAKNYSEGASLDDFTVSTFRRFLAADMRARIAEATEPLPKDNLMGTTHAICKRILGIDQVADPERKAEFCSKMGRGIPYSKELDKKEEYRMEPVDRNAPLGNQLFTILDYCANNFLKPREGLYKAPLPPGVKAGISPWLIDEFAERWDAWKNENGLHDFTDMLREVLEQKVSPGTNFLIEDEFHDKTPLQYEVYKLWAEATENVLVIGDPLQCIYSFWGTNPQFFWNEYKDADERIVLPTSWRFGQNLWEYAKRIVHREGMDTPEIKCVGETSVRSLTWGEFVHLVPRMETEDCMYLVRANYMEHFVADVLSNAGIPYRGPGGGLDKRAIDVYNTVCRVCEKMPEMSLLGVPTHLRLPTAEAEVMVKVFPRECFSETKQQMRDEISRCEASYLVPITPRLADVVRKPFVELKNVSAHRKAQLRVLYKNRGGKRVEGLTHTIITIHGSKGGQADFVFLFDEITPQIHRTSDGKNEARVFYVGATRPKKTLFVVHGPEGKLSYSLPNPQPTAKEAPP